MSNPKLFGQPNTYQSPTNWVNVNGCTPSSANDNCGIHTNSGVGNYWFFLLSQGGSGINDLNNSYNIAPVGISNASKIVYRMEKFYLTASSGYLDARNTSITASTYLFGANSCETIAVANAWYAVGVGGPYQYTNVDISGPSTVCTSDALFTVNNVPIGCFVTWSCTANITFDHQPGNPKVFTAIGNGTGSVTATINLANCSPVPVTAKAVWVGTHAFTGTVNGPTQLTPGSYATYSVPLAQGATSYNWSIPVGCYNTYCWRIVTGQGTRSIYVQAGAIGSGAIQCTAYGCGGTDSRYIPVTVLNPGDPCPPATLMLSPNPSKDGNFEIDVINPPCDPTLTMSTTATVIVTNSMGTTLYSGKHTGKKINIKGMKLKPGMYNVVYISNNTKLDETMIVE